MDKELIKQKVISNIEQRKTFWMGIMLLSGGMTAIIINPDSYVKIGLFLIGIFAFCFFMSGIKCANLNLDYLFKLMEKNNDINTK